MSQHDIDKVRAIIKASAVLASGIECALLAAGCHRAYAKQISFDVVFEWARLSGSDPYRAPRASVGSVAAMVAGYYRLAVCWDYPDDVAAGVKASKLADTVAAVSALDGRWSLGITSPPVRIVPVGVWRSMSADSVARLLVAVSHGVRSQGVDDLTRTHRDTGIALVSLDGELPLSAHLDHVAENGG